MKSGVQTIRRVGVVANDEKPACVPLVRRVVRALAGHKRPVLLDATTAALTRLRLPAVGSIEELARQCDLLLVAGGDGTMLRIARAVAGIPTPILGINVGSLGFLTEVPPEALESSIRKLIAGRFTLEERALLNATIEQQHRRTEQIALNDIVLGRGQTSRLIELEVSVNDELLTRYRCDGLIVSSPTGSTAYSLAAGGGVVSPDAEVMTLTPICPHTLSIRPVIVSLNAVVRVRLISEKLIATLAADGQQEVELKAGDTTVIRRSARSIRLVRLEGSSFFSTLRQKFGWSGSNVESR